jgi:hypothetical protein
MLFLWLRFWRSRFWASRPDFISESTILFSSCRRLRWCVGLPSFTALTYFESADPALSW